MRRATKWSVALVLSGVVHAGAAAILLAPAEDEVRIAGSSSLEIAVLGSFEDTWAAGEPVDDAQVVEPSESAADPLPPIGDSREVVETEPVRAMAAVSPPASASPLAPPLAPPLASPVAPTASPAVPEAAFAPVAPPVAADVAEPPLADAPPEARIFVPMALADPVEENEADPATPVAPPVSEAVEADAAVPEAPVAEAMPVASAAAGPAEPHTAIAMVSPVERFEQARPSAITPIEPAPAATVVDDAPVTEPVEEIAIPEDVPLPSPRPEPPSVREARVRPDPVRPEPPRQQRQSSPEAKAEKPKAAPQRKASGSGGRQDRDATRGQADGHADGRASAQGSGGGRSGAPGNARASNYPGQVVSRLRRSVRGVPRSAIRSARRDVHVAFTIDAGGGVGGVRITQSSGSPALDEAALASVRRAAPFPPIPADAGRSSWQFSVPLGLAR